MYDPISATVGASAILGGASGMYGASLQAHAQNQASERAAEAAQSAQAQQWAMYQQNREDIQPYRQQGRYALGELGYLMGLPMDQTAAGDGSDKGGTQALSQGYGVAGSLMQPFQYDPNQDPGTKFRMQQGLEAVNQNAALGGYFRGQTGLALNDYAQGQASQEYQNAFNRDLASKNNIYNQLAGISGTGQVSTAQLGQQGMNAASQSGAYGMQGAQLWGQGQTGAANAWAGAYQNAGNQIMGGMGTYMNYNMMNNYLNSSGGGGGGYYNTSPMDTSMGGVPGYTGGGGY